jgi:hypothetical protein
MTLRILKAFSWMRWRALMNSLERTGSRDILERFSLAVEQLGPIMAAILLVPSALILAVIGGYSGWSLAQGTARPLSFDVIRFLLFAACGLTIVGPVFLPAADRTLAVRLLLLPISRPILYLAQTVTAIVDPWILLVVPIVAAVPVGLAVGGAWGAASLSAAAGLLLVTILLGISAIVTSLIQLLVRDRRRGELLTLLFILVLPAAAMLPAIVGDGGADGAHERISAGLTVLERRVLPLVPSELYVAATRTAMEGMLAVIVAPLAGLAFAAGSIHAVAFLTFIRFLDSPGATGGTSRVSKKKSRAWRIPGLSPATSAIATSHIRLTIRTPRGRSTILSPLMAFAVFAAMMWRGRIADFSIVPLESGVGLAIFGSFISLLSILPLAMNQFAIDGAGLTLEFLSPLDDRDLLRGKALGNAVIAAVPVLSCLAGAAVLFPAGSLSVWLSILLGLPAAYLLLAPIAAALSAVFPRPVDLNSIGRGSNAHGAATLLGLLAMTVAGALPFAIALVTMRFLGRPGLALILLFAWFVLSVVLCKILFASARSILARRRENLVLIR